MARQAPHLLRLGPDEVVLVTEYDESSDGGIRPKASTDVTDAYERLRSADDRNGVPLRRGPADRTPGHVLYLSTARQQNWRARYDQLPPDEVIMWERIAQDFLVHQQPNRKL